METLTPDISVLLPVRQWRASTLSAVQSILTQTHDSLEVLLIGHDDVDQMATRLPADPRIRFVARQQPGIVGALNTGLAQARGQHIARMDDGSVGASGTSGCRFARERHRSDNGCHADFAGRAAARADRP